MTRYFKMIEIDADEFIGETGEDLDCCQLIVPIGKVAFIAVDEESEYEIQIPLGCLEE